ncbi:MAG: flippase-like domain-containing protein [Deltaproteobacteria bacterium]|nr:flippase-like domain-containing protein [Deltaproteobacteria bacterium]
MTRQLKTRLLLALRVVVAAAALLALGFFVRNLDWRALVRALGQTSVAAVALAIVINFIHIGLRAWRFRVMLAPAAHVPFWRLFHYVVTMYASSTLLPARMGEVVRIWLLKQREGVPRTTTAGVAVVEKVFDGLAMCIAVAPVPFLVHGLPKGVSTSIVTLVTVVVSAVVVGWVIAWSARRATAVDSTGWRAALRKFALGVDVLVRPGSLAAALGISLLAWSLQIGIVLLLLHSMNLALPPQAALLILLTLNLAVTVPSTPAQVGAFEVGALVALDLLGVPRAQGLAFALVYHAIQAVPLALIGLVELRLVRELGARAKSDPEEAAADAAVATGE